MERLTIKAPSGLIHLKDNTEMTMNVAIKKLSDFEDLEEQNRLLKLPCAVGDTVYIVKGGEVLRNYVVQIHIAQVEAQTFFSCYDDCFGIEQIGKTVFLTREEAETALKELEGREE